MRPLSIERLPYAKVVDLFILLGDKEYISLASAIRKRNHFVTYSHASQIIRQFEEAGLLTRKKKGRTIHCVFSEKGKKLHGLLSVFQKEWKEAIDGNSHPLE
jgi:DNA-binding MarR family transcriptional regulator